MADSQKASPPTIADVSKAAALRANMSGATGATPGVSTLAQSAAGKIGSMTGAANTAANPPGGLPGKDAGSGSCTQGGGGGPGESLGAQNNNAYGSGQNPAMIAAGQCAQQRWQAANPGMKVYAFSGKSGRPKGASRHPSGNATDFAIYGSDGVMMNNLRNGDTPAYRAYESFAETYGSCWDEQNGAGSASRDLRWGGNFSGDTYHDSMHIDYTPGGPTARGDVFSGQKNPLLKNNSIADGSGKYNGPTTGAAANSGDSTGEALGGQNNNAYSDQGNAAGGSCGEGSGGCKPSSAAAPAAAAAMNAGKGLAMNGPMGAALGAFGAMGTNPGAAIQGAVQQALGSAMGAVTSAVGAAGANLLGGASPLLNGAGSLLANGAKQFLTTGAMPDPMTALTQGVGQIVQKIGGGILPGLTGVIPQALAGGNLQGLMTGVIQNSVGSIMGAGMAQLGGFTSVFSNVMGAAGSLSGIKNNLLSSAQQIFGNASTLTGLTTAKIPGFNIGNSFSGPLQSLSSEGISDSINFFDTVWKPTLDKTVNLTNSFESVLQDVTSRVNINAFSSLYDGFNSLATQGLGKLSENLPALGVDLANLNRLGDLDDLLNIGTPHQLARQMMENGLGISTGLAFKLNEAGINHENLYQASNSDTLNEILASIDDEESIQQIRDTFLLDPRLNITNAADLLDPEIIFPFSYEDNNFEELRDMALTLAMCGGTGRLKTFGEFGRVVATMETLKTFNVDDSNFVTMITPKEMADMLEQMPVNGKYNNNGPTVADFIGTLAGYTHDTTLPRIDEILYELYNDPRTDDYYNMMDTLAVLLEGGYYTPPIPPLTVGTLTVPGFGSFSTMDAAVTAVVNGIEAELQVIKNLGNNDPALKELLDELEALHMSSAEALYHEQDMRQKYGLEFGNSQRKNNFLSDGTTTSFPLQGKESSDHLVYINGVNQLEGFDWSYNKNTNNIIFNSPPAANSTVSMVYSIDAIKPSASPADVYDFAMNLENLALETGHGGPADFLKRIIQDDEYGMKINAVLVQSRNFERLSEYEIACPGFNRIFEDGNNSKDFNFVDSIGIWTPDTTRAAEIWLQTNLDAIENKTYIVGKYNLYKDMMQPDLDLLMQNITRRLIFFNDGNIVMSDLMADIYTNNSNNEVFINPASEYDIGYNSDLPFEGYILGPYNEIISMIMDKENIQNDVFSSKPSTDTERYLQSINVDINVLVRIIQKVLTSNGTIYTGLDEGDFRSIFGIQSVSKSLLQNIANNY